MKNMYKVVNREHIHGNIVYVKDKIIHDIKKFNPHVKDNCCEGGLHYTNFKYISRFLFMGRYIYDVEIPEEAQVVKAEEGNPDKWRASCIILRNKRDILDIETIKLFRVSEGIIISWITYNQSYGKIDVPYVKGVDVFEERVKIRNLFKIFEYNDLSGVKKIEFFKYLNSFIFRDDALNHLKVKNTQIYNEYARFAH